MTLFNPDTLILHLKRAPKAISPLHALHSYIDQDLLQRVEGMERTFPVVREGSSQLDKKCCDLILSCLKAHWNNDLPCFLKACQQALRPKGLFLGALWGGQTLYELRESLLKAELSLRGGASPRVAPMVQLADASRLLSHAGFVDPVVDRDVFTLSYPSLWDLMQDLRNMGETNKMRDRLKTFTPRKLFDQAEKIYRNEWGKTEGKLPATFEVIYLTGWGS